MVDRIRLGIRIGGEEQPARVIMFPDDRLECPQIYSLEDTHHTHLFLHPYIWPTSNKCQGSRSTWGISVVMIWFLPLGGITGGADVNKILEINYSATTVRSITLEEHGVWGGL